MLDEIETPGDCLTVALNSCVDRMDISVSKTLLCARFVHHRILIRC